MVNGDFPVESQNCEGHITFYMCSEYIIRIRPSITKWKIWYTRLYFSLQLIHIDGFWR